MTIQQALHHGQQRLQRRTASPGLDAEVLLAHLLQTDKATLLREGQRVVPTEILDHYQAWIAARAAGYPVAYLTHQQDFYGLRLYVAPDVLIPRPATELLVDQVRQHVSPDEPVRLADIGTGSGAIALALTVHLPRATVVATDISPRALSIAHYNARHHRLTERMTFAYGSLLEPFSRLPVPEVIVANLPYLRPDEMTEPTIQHEPRLALAGGETGLLLVWRLLDQLHSVQPWRGLVLELGPEQVEPVSRHLQAQWPRYRLEKISDGQNNRGVALWANP